MATYKVIYRREGTFLEYQTNLHSKSEVRRFLRWLKYNSYVLLKIKEEVD
jgi:hypothetical protein